MIYDELFYAAAESVLIFFFWVELIFLSRDGWWWDKEIQFAAIFGGFISFCILIAPYTYLLIWFTKKAKSSFNDPNGEQNEVQEENYFDEDETDSIDTDEERDENSSLEEVSEDDLSKESRSEVSGEYQKEDIKEKEALEIFSLEHKQIHDEYVEKLSQINQKILELQGIVLFPFFHQRYIIKWHFLSISSCFILTTFFMWFRLFFLIYFIFSFLYRNLHATYWRLTRDWATIISKKIQKKSKDAKYRKKSKKEFKY